MSTTRRCGATSSGSTRWPRARRSSSTCWPVRRAGPGSTPRPSRSTSPWSIIAAVWDRTRDAVEVPRPSVFERLLRAAGLPPREARLVAVASAFRGVWLIGVVAVLAFAALAAVIGRAGGLWFFLAVAPVAPCLLVAFSYDWRWDPALEPEMVTPYPALRLVLLRTIAVLALALPAVAAARAGRAWGDAVRLAAAGGRLRRGGAGRVHVGQPAERGHVRQCRLAPGGLAALGHAVGLADRGAAGPGPGRPSWCWPQRRSSSSWCAGAT